MFFRNLQLFRLAPGPEPSAEKFQEQMAPFVFQPCSALMPESRGWIPPRGDERLLYTLNQHWLAALGTEQKLLPSSVVRQEVQQRAADLEARSGFKPSRKRLRDLKDEITDELLPRAFSRYRTTFCWIDPAGRWLVIDASTSKRADEVTEWINKSTDALSFAPVKSRRGPASAMTEWLVEGEGPAGFSIDRECVLQSPLEEKSTVRYTHHSLVDTDEIRNHITQAGKVPVQLALTWEDRVSFVLTDKLEIRRVSFLDIVRGDREADAESAEEQFASDFTLMTAMLGRFLSELLETLDGVEE